MSGWGGWLGLECDLLVANAAEAAPHSAPSGSSLGALWERASYLSADDGYVLLTPDEPPQPEGACAVGWTAPGECLTVDTSRRTLTWAVLGDDRTWTALVRRLRAHPGAVRIAFQVWSAGMVELVNRLEEDGVEVDRVALPSASGGSVSHWNTKTGGRLLLEQTLRRDLLPAATVCSTLPEVAMVVGRRPRDGFVVKTDVGAGGVGVEVFPADPDRTPAEVVGRLEGFGRVATAAGIKGKGFGSMSGPFLVEELVGPAPTDPDRRSPTADLHVGADGRIHGVGVTDQLLVDGIAYAGSRTVEPLPPKAEATIAEIGAAVGAELHVRGYVGPVNIDHVLGPDGQVWVVEVNVRQSAPLDQVLTMARAHGPSWSEGWSYTFVEGGAPADLVGPDPESAANHGRCGAATLVTHARDGVHHG